MGLVNIYKGLIFLLLALVLALGVCGCNSKSGHGEAYLLQVGEEFHATKNDFKRFWEAYSAPLLANADMEAFDETNIKLAKMEAFDQFVIAMLMEARAEDLGIFISNEELEAEISKFKEEYSDDVFNDTLRKAAMYYELWRESFKRRLLMEQVMRIDLYARGEITPEDVEKYGGVNGGNKNRANPEDVLERVYRAKAEHDFQGWIQQLQTMYPVKIDYDELASILSE